MDASFKQHNLDVKMLRLTVFIFEEVSDQNFVDENIKIDNTSRTCSSKRMKTQKIIASIKDQVMYNCADTRALHRLSMLHSQFSHVFSCSYRWFPMASLLCLKIHLQPTINKASLVCWLV